MTELSGTWRQPLPGMSRQAMRLPQWRMLPIQGPCPLRARRVGNERGTTGSRGDAGTTPQEMAFYRRLLVEGGTLALGTDAPLTPLGLHLRLGLRALRSSGLPAAQVRRTATAVPARLFGVGDDLGPRNRANSPTWWPSTAIPSTTSTTSSALHGPRAAAWSIARKTWWGHSPPPAHGRPRRPARRQPATALETVLLPERVHPLTVRGATGLRAAGPTTRGTGRTRVSHM